MIRDCGDGSENVQISSGQGGDSKGIIKSSQGSYSVKSSDPTADLPIHIMPSKEDQSSTLSRKQTGLLAPLIAGQTASLSLTLRTADLIKNFLFQVLQGLKIVFMVHFVLVISNLKKLGSLSCSTSDGKNNYVSVPDGFGWGDNIILGDPIGDHNQILMNTGSPSF